MRMNHMRMSIVKTMDAFRNRTDNRDLEMVQAMGRDVRYPHAKW